MSFPPMARTMRSGMVPNNTPISERLGDPEVLIADKEVPVGIACPNPAALRIARSSQLAASRARLAAVIMPARLAMALGLSLQFAGQLAWTLHPGIEERQQLGRDLHGA